MKGGMFGAVQKLQLAAESAEYVFIFNSPVAEISIRKRKRQELSLTTELLKMQMSLLQMPIFLMFTAIC